MNLKEKLKRLTCPECLNVGMGYMTSISYGHGDSTHNNKVRCDCGYNREINGNWGNEASIEELCEIADMYYKGSDPIINPM